MYLPPRSFGLATSFDFHTAAHYARRFKLLPLVLLCGLSGISNLLIFAQTQHRTKYTIKRYPVKRKRSAQPRISKAPAKSSSTVERAFLTTGGNEMTFAGVPAPFRVKSYCITNPRELWGTAGQAIVYHYFADGSSRDFTMVSKQPFDQLFGAYFNNEGVGWVVGDKGVIFHTPDSGKTWIEQSIGGPEPLLAVTCVDNKHCWAVGNNGLIVRTSDGGKVWQKIVTANEEPLNAVDFVDAKNGWAAGWGGVVLHTTDGGETWERHLVPVECRTPCSKWGEQLNAVHFVNESVGWAAADDQIARTNDGGWTWKVTSIADEDLNVQEILALVSHDGKNVWAIDEYGHNFVSRDGGIQWMRMNSEANARIAASSSRSRPRK
jgi:photosystem II stability/assembly factor-like uncharacterized protein